eukprot:g1927.t1
MSLECPVSKEAYEEPPSERAPVRLDCGHNVCRKSAQQLLEQEAGGEGSIVCPVCRKATTAPEGGADALPTDFVVLKKLSSRGAEDAEGGGRADDDTAACPVCNFSLGDCGDGTPATHYCQECAEYLCGQCNAMHARGRSTKAHAATTVDELLQQGGGGGALPPAAPEMCPRHAGKPLELWCDTCSKRICVHCTVEEHVRPEHVYSFFETAFKNHQPGMVAAVEAVAARLPPVEAAITELERMKAEIKARRDTLRAEVGRRFDAHIDALKRRKAEVMTLCSDKANHKYKVLEKQREALQNNLDAMRAGCDFAARTLERGAVVPDHALMVRARLLSDLERMKRQFLELRPDECTRLEFVDCDTNLSGIPAYGDIDASITLAANCTADGMGLKHAMAGEEATFTVHAVDHRGEARTDGGDVVEAELVCGGGGDADGGGGAEEKDGGDEEDEALRPLAAAVTDNGDGTYSCSFTPRAAHKGTARLYVRMLGAPIDGSPFTVVVQAISAAAPAFDSARKGRYITLSAGDRTVSNPRGSHGIVLSGEPLTSGQHYWEFRIDQCARGNSSGGYIMLGIASEGFNENYETSLNSDAAHVYSIYDNTACGQVNGVAVQFNPPLDGS